MIRLNIIQLTIKIFLLSSIVYIIGFEFFMYADWSYEKCDTIECFFKNFKYNHIYFVSVFLLMSYLYSFTYYYLLKNNLSKKKKYIICFLTLFFVGLIIFFINEFYYKIWAEYDILERIVMFLVKYIETIFKYYREVLIFFLSVCVNSILVNKTKNDTSIFN